VNVFQKAGIVVGVGVVFLVIDLLSKTWA